MPQYGMPQYNNPQFNPLAPNDAGLNPMMAPKMNQVMTGVETSVRTFGRISQILQATFEALHMSFSSVLRFMSHFAMLKREFYVTVRTLTFLRVLYLLYLKMRRFVGRLFGFKDSTLKKRRGHSRLNEADYSKMMTVWSESEEIPWGSLLIFLLLTFLLLNYLYNKARQPTSDSKQNQNQNQNQSQGRR